MSRPREMTAGMQAVDPEVQSYLDRVVSTLRDHLGADLIGVYLHGSLAAGAYQPGRSDVDVLAVCAGPLSPEGRRNLGQALVAIPGPTSGGDLEFSLVTEASVLSRSVAPPFEIHVSHEEPFVIDGSQRPGDEDLVVHFAMAWAGGRTLIGPAPHEVFPEPEHAALISGFLSDLRWAQEHGAAAWEGHDMPELASMAYRVLNAARSWRFVETGELGSKVEGGAWLEQRDPGPETRALLDAALAYQRGATPEPPDARMVDAFVQRVEDVLRRALVDLPPHTE
jgi:predicted nucleotidyltransferase